MILILIFGEALGLYGLIVALILSQWIIKENKNRSHFIFSYFISSLRENKSDDESVQSQGLSENQNKDHSDENGRLLGVCSDSSVSDNSNAQTGSQRWKSAAKSSSQVFISHLSSVSSGRDLLSDDDGNDHSVDSQDTSHDDWNDGFHDKTRLQDSHRTDSDSTLGGSVRSSQVSED